MLGAGLGYSFVCYYNHLLTRSFTPPFFFDGRQRTFKVNSVGQRYVLSYVFGFIY